MITNWIKAPVDTGSSAPEFRKTFSLKKEVKHAVAKITAMGVYELRINGKKVGDALFAPGWTSYGSRVQAQSYDITDLLEKETVFGIVTGNAWAVGHIGLGSWEKVFADHVSLWAEISVEYADGTEEILVTDESWQVYTTEILSTDIYNGDTVDHTAEIRFLGNAAADDSVHTRIVDQVSEPVREQERIGATECFVAPNGEKIVDFGQNLAGYAEIRVRGKRGDRIVITHAEVLDAEGNFYNENLRSAENRNTYVLSGNGEEVFKPVFSFQGFRYIRLDEWPEDVAIRAENFTAVAIYTDMKRTGDFLCGNEKINQLYSNIIWGQRSNFIDVPTDCPQRDERLGWTGDAEVFCRTAAINYDVEKIFTKWLGDVALEQGDDGSVPDIVPMIEKDGRPLTGRGSSAWADACVICPWEIYRAYGNKELLRTHYPMMKKWIGYMRAFGEEEYLFVGGNQYGDWLAMDSGGNHRGATQTDFVASAFFAYSTSLVIKAGKILGEDVGEYENLYRKVRTAFRSAFMKDGLPCIYPKADGLATNRPVKGLTQTAIVLILRFGLFEESERQGLIDKLAELIAENGGCMNTGFVGTPHILHALSEQGRSDLAYDLLFREQIPSWLFAVNHGATTVWEHWDCLKEDGSFQNPKMTSFNHYAYGSVFDWIFGVSVGITVDDGGEGYRKITVAPIPDRRLGFVKGSIESRQGKIEVDWRYLSDGHVRYEITVPSGVSATIALLGQKPIAFSGGRYLKTV